jgi:Ni,Fe-hydrogenase I cytochrome b subunit
MVTVVNSKADVLKATQALAVNVNAAKSLQEIELFHQMIMWVLCGFVIGH